MSEACIRCGWAQRTQEEREYHDEEWGAPLHDDLRLFEFLILEGAQAGLSWLTILRKRPAYRAAFEGFNPQLVARYDQNKIAGLMKNPGIIRNRLKLEAAVVNADGYLKVQEVFGSFDAYLWRFVDGKPIQNAWSDYREAPTHSPESDALSRDLKLRGFKFVGSTICYALMQAVGMVNDHSVECFRWRELGGGRGNSLSGNFTVD